MEKLKRGEIIYCELCGEEINNIESLMKNGGQYLQTPFNLKDIASKARETGRLFKEKLLKATEKAKEKINHYREKNKEDY